MRSIHVTTYESWEEMRSALGRHFHDSFWLFSGLVVLVAVLELLSLDTARALHQKNKQLYIKAWLLNFTNLFLLGMPAHALTNLWLTQDFLPVEDHQHGLTKIVKIGWQVVQITCIHSLVFHQVHKTFHSHPKLYRWHKFHHLFNTHVPPVSASAVSPVEYMCAYLSPFLISIIVVPTIICPTALTTAVIFIGTANVVMHTPRLEAYYDTIIPAWMVGTGDHLEHHKRLNCHYSAPTLDMDYISEQGQSLMSALWTTTSVNGTAPTAANKVDDEE